MRTTLTVFVLALVAVSSTLLITNRTMNLTMALKPVSTCNMSLTMTPRPNRALQRISKK